MSPERWEEFKEVVTTILERDRRDWPFCLFDRCGLDVDLFLEASSLLAVSRSMGDFIEIPAWHVLVSSQAMAMRAEEAQR